MPESKTPVTKVDPDPAIASVTTVVSGLDDRSYVDWSAVFGGAIIALGLWMLLTSFGASVGLLSLPPWGSVEVSATALTITTAAWFAIVQIFATGSGAYLSGRLRHRVAHRSDDEVAFRDGANGLLVWGVALFAAAALAVLAGFVSIAVNLGDGGNRTTADANNAELVIDQLFRPQLASASQEAEDNSETAAQSISIVPQNGREQVNRDEVARILNSADADAQTSQADNEAYLTALVVSQTNLNGADAKARVNKMLSNWQQSRTEAAETAQKAGALLGFWTVAILLLSGLASWWAGALGGSHRDRIS